MDAPVLRARSPAEILDAAFQVVRLHFVDLMLATAAFMLLPLTLTALVPAESLWWVMYLARACGTLAAGAAIALVSDFYLGRPHGAGIAIRAAWGEALMLWVVTFIKGFVVGVGLLLLIVPGIIFFAWSYVMPVTVIVEDAGPDDAWSRARELARGNVGRILLTGGLTWVLMMLGGIGVGAVLGLISAGGDMIRASAFIQVLVQAIAYPFIGVVTTLTYFDLRIRREALDVELVAQRLGATAPKTEIAF